MCYHLYQKYIAITNIFCGFIYVDTNIRKMFGQTHPRQTIVFYLGQGLGLEPVLKGTLTYINELPV